MDINFGGNDVEFEEKQFLNILYYLEEIYGRDWKKATDTNNEISNGFIFKGKKVTFEFCRVVYPQGTNKHRGYIHIYDNVLHKSFLESQL